MNITPFLVTCQSAVRVRLSSEKRFFLECCVLGVLRCDAHNLFSVSNQNGICGVLNDVSMFNSGETVRCKWYCQLTLQLQSLVQKLAGKPCEWVCAWVSESRNSWYFFQNSNNFYLLTCADCLHLKNEQKQCHSHNKHFFPYLFCQKFCLQVDVRNERHQCSLSLDV